MDYLFLADFVSAVSHGMPCSSDARVCEPAIVIHDVLKVSFHSSRCSCGQLCNGLVSVV